MDRVADFIIARFSKEDYCGLVVPVPHTLERVTVIFKMINYPVDPVNR